MGLSGLVDFTVGWMDRELLFFFFFLELLPQILFAPYPLRPFSFPRGKFSCFQSGLGGEGWEVRDVLAATILKTQLGRRLRISLFSVQNLI